MSIWLTKLEKIHEQLKQAINKEEIPKEEADFKLYCFLSFAKNDFEKRILEYKVEKGEEKRGGKTNKKNTH